MILGEINDNLVCHKVFLSLSLSSLQNCAYTIFSFDLMSRVIGFNAMMQLVLNIRNLH